MTTNDFNLGLNDAAELCEFDNSQKVLPANFNYQRAAQACREAVELREGAESAFTSFKNGYERIGIDQLRKALGKP